MLEIRLVLSVVPITSLFNTGIQSIAPDGSDVLVPQGSTDPHYQIITSPTSLNSAPAFVTRTPLPANWVNNTSATQWVSPQQNDALGDSVGTYIYRTAFNVDGLNPLTAQISGVLFTDNIVLMVSLNGKDERISGGAFTASSGLNFSIVSDFVAGLNALDFYVYNDQPGSNPSGLQVAMSGTATPGPATAPISSWFSTGVQTVSADGTVVLAPQRSIDPHYTIISSPTSNSSAPAYITETPLPAFWVGNNSVTQWISPQPTDSLGDSPGTYIYETTFDLTGLDPSTAQIGGKLFVDNTISHVTLNGKDEHISGGGLDPSSGLSFSIIHDFVAGLNTLDYYVVNGGSGSNPSGLQVAVSGTAIPETLAPVGTSNTLTVTENQAYIFASADFGFSDPNNDPANTFTNVQMDSLTTAGTLSVNGTPVFAGQFISISDINAGKLVFTPATNAAGSPYSTFTFRVQDQRSTLNLDPNPKTMTIDVSVTKGVTYITSESLPGIQKVDTATGAVTNVLITPHYVDSLLFDPNGSIVYTLEVGSTGNQIGVFDPLTNSNRILVSDLSFDSGDLTLTPDGNSLLVSLRAATTNSVVRIDLTTGAVTPFASINAANGIAFDNAGNLFVDSRSDNTLIQLDPTTGAILKTISLDTELPAVGSQPDGLAFDPVTQSFWIAENYSPGMGLIQVSNYLDSTPDLRLLMSPLPITRSLKFDGLSSDGSGNIYVAAANLFGPDLGAIVEYNIAGSTFTPLTVLSVDDIAPMIPYGNPPAPTGTSRTVSLLENQDFTFAASDFGFIDPNNNYALNAVKITTTPSAGTLFDNGNPVTGGQFVSVADIGSGLLVFAPATYGNGMAYTSFTFQVQDNSGNAVGSLDTDPSPKVMTVNVTPVSQAPVGTSNTVTTLENSAYPLVTTNFGFSDPNDSPPNNLKAVEITTLPGAGKLTDHGAAVTAGQFVGVADITSGKLVFTPTTNAYGTGYATFTFQVQDDGGIANGGATIDPHPKVMTINVSPPAPKITAPSTGSVNENAALTFSTGNGNAISPIDVAAVATSDTLKLTATHGSLILGSTAGLKFTSGTNSSASMTIWGTLANLNAALNGLVFIPTAGFSGSASMSLTAKNGRDNLTGSANVVIAVNAPPNATAPKTVSVDENASLTFSTGHTNAISVLDSAAAANSDTCTVTATHGKLALGSITGLTFVSGTNGSASMTVWGTLVNLNAAMSGLTFTPTAGYSGSASLTITAKNGRDNLTGWANVAITVNAPPVVAAPAAASVNTNASLTFSTGHANAISVWDAAAVANSDTLTLAVTHGTLVLGSTTGLTFTSGNNGSASMTIWGTVANINAALNGLVFTSTTGFSGSASLTIAAKNGRDNLTGSANVAITVN